MAKKKETKSAAQIKNDAEVLASLMELPQNYLTADNPEEALARIQEVREEVSKETKKIKKNTKTKTEIQKEAKELDKTLKEHNKAIKKNKDSGGFEVVTDKKGEMFIKAGKKKVKLDADALWNINNTEPKAKVEKPKKEKKKSTKNNAPAQNKEPKPKKQKVKKENPTQWDKKSFSVSKDRLTEILKNDTKTDSSLMIKEYSKEELEQKIKSFSKAVSLYKFANQQVTILKNNLALKLKNQSPSKATRFVTDLLLEILGDAKDERETSEKKNQLKRLTKFVNNVENKVLVDKNLPESEKKFLMDILVIVFNTIKQDIKINSSLRNKINKIDLSGQFDSALDVVKTFNPFAGFLLETAVSSISKTGKFAGKLFKNKSSELIDSDLSNIFDFKESERAEKISRAGFNSPKVKTQEYYGSDESDFPESLDVLIDDQNKQTEVLNEILDTLDTTKETSEELLVQNKEWKKDEQIRISKDRVSAENAEYLNPFKGQIEKPKEKKDGFLSKLFSSGSNEGIGIKDIFTGNILSKIFLGGTKVITKYAGLAVKGLATFAFGKLIPSIFRTGIGVIGRTLAVSAGALLSTPALVTAAAIGLGALAYTYRDEIWEVIKNLFTTIQEPVKKAITWIGDKLYEVKDLIFSKGIELFTNAKDFFKKTFGLFSSDDSTLEAELIKLQKDLDNERRGIASTTRYITKNKLPITTEVSGSNLIVRNQKVSQLEQKIKDTRQKIVAKGANPSSPNIYGGVGKMTAMSESGNNAGVISSGRGDYGGKSYGIYQLASKTGTLQEFIDQSPYKDVLGKYEIGSPEFDNAWRELAKSDPNFANAQHEFIHNTHYGPMVDGLARAGIDITSRGDALKETVFSTANQYGPNSSLIKNALKGKDVNSMSDEDIIGSIQDYKLNNLDSLHRSSSASVRQGVANRIVKEKGEMLARARNDKLLQGGKDKDTRLASNNIINNNMIGTKGGNGGSHGGTSSTRTSDSTMNMLQMHMMRGTPMG